MTFIKYAKFIINGKSFNKLKKKKKKNENSIKNKEIRKKNFFYKIKSLVF